MTSVEPGVISKQLHRKSSLAMDVCAACWELKLFIWTVIPPFIEPVATVKTMRIRHASA